MTPHLVQSARFLVAGGATLLSNLASFAVAVRAGAPSEAAAAVGIAVSFWVSFFLNRHWTFRGGDGRAGAQILRFTLFVGAYYSVNVLLLGLFEHRVGMQPEVAQLSALVLLTPASYLASAFWVYRTRTERSSSSSQPHPPS